MLGLDRAAPAQPPPPPPSSSSSYPSRHLPPPPRPPPRSTSTSSSSSSSSPPPPPPPLPRGDCRFILLLPDVTGQRCACQGYRLNDTVPGTSCECGHQACYHAPEPRHEGLGRREWDAMRARVAALEADCRAPRADDLRDRIRKLEALVEPGQTRLDEDVRAVCRAVQGLHANLTRLQMVACDRFLTYDDRIDGLEDRATAVDDDLRRVRARVVAIDDLAMRLEDRLPASPALEDGARLRSAPARPRRRSRTPSPEIQARPTSWTARVMLVPGSIASHGPVTLSRAQRRCASRGLLRDVLFADDSAHTFRRTIEETFGGVVNGRRWIPLSHRELKLLHGGGASSVVFFSTELGLDDTWDRRILRERGALGEPDGPGSPGTLYITIEDDAFTWEAMRRLPATEAGQDDAGWEDDEPPVDDAGDAAGREQRNGHTEQQQPPPPPPPQPPTEPPNMSNSNRKRRSHSVSSVVDLPSPKKRNVAGQGKIIQAADSGAKKGSGGEHDTRGVPVQDGGSSARRIYAPFRLQPATTPQRICYDMCPSTMVV